MRLEPANAADCEELLSLSKRRMKKYFDQSSITWSDKKRKQYLMESKVFRIFSPDFCGYIQMCERETSLFIYDLQVFEGFQGKGIGTSVIRSVFELAKSKSLSSVRLGSFKSNPATKLYERLGFEIVKQNDYFSWYGYRIN